jgi:6-pyruvoyltetrahydropterin/6-carboxytetrahydropterin synthase
MKNRITRVFYVEMAHRLNGHEGKCEHLHGHSYRVEVSVSGPLDSLGRVVDFSDLKVGIGGWLMNNLDHGTTLSETDPLVAVLEPTKTKLYVMPEPPTAENIARLIASETARLHPTVAVDCVRVWETEHGMAEWVP